MPAFKTLVYSPDVQVVVAGKNGMIDISADLVGGDVQRSGEGVSFISLRLANKGLRYNNAFRRMDRIVVRMKRVKWVTVFSGYLNRVPSIQLYPGVVGIQASCTLKRLKYTYWDPGLTPSAELFNQFGTDLANGGENKDAGMGFMLKNILQEVGGWGEDDVIVQPFPTAFIDYLAQGAEKYKDTRSEALKKFKELFDYDEATGATAAGAGTVANGNLADATFTSIGKPANGVAYSNEEIVWIVTNAGWSGEDVVIGSSIIKAESSGNPAAVNNNNPDGSIDRGLWQINSVHDGKYPGENRFDPAVSTKIARDLYRARGNWDDWSTLVYHGTAQGHFNTFRPLVASGGVAPPGSGTSGAGGLAAAQGTAEPAKAQAQQTPTSPPPAAASEPYGLPTGSNVSYASGGFPDWVYALGQQFNLQASTYPGHQEGAGSGPGYAPNPNRQNRGIDWSGSVADMQRFAEYLYGIAPGTPALEQIIWMNPNTGQKIGWAGRSPDTSGSYYRDDYGGHQDHVHTRQNASLDGSGNMTGAAPGAPGAGGAAGASAFQNKLAKNLFGYLFDPTDYYNETSAWYVDDETGARSSINDVALLESVVAICRARMCKYMSAPTGEFLAYYPDYFGLDGTPAKLDLEDIELKNFGVDLNDDNVVTHMFVAGMQEYGGQANASDIGWMATSGIATIMDEWLFDRVIGASVSAPDVTEAGEFLERFGIRPLKEQYADIRGTENPGIELMIAVQRFMQKWAEQSLTNVEMTFMPELFPGMRVNLVGHDITVYVNAVNHSFDFQSGFRTTASIMAPSKTSAFVLPKKEGDG